MEKRTYTFNVGDRIYALRGISPGSRGVVSKLDPEYKTNDLVHVIYDGGHKDIIFGYMLEPEDEYDTD